MDNKVAVCIPTYNSEQFIAKTLACAQDQTHDNIEIIVSVDLSEDGTEEICRAHAKRDKRIVVLKQDSRLGWSQNANASLDAVSAPYFFLFFHDDFIENNYVEVLLNTLISDPEAVSAHCDLEEFGLLNEIKPANEYLGKPLNRLVEFMMTQGGTTLRSMVRKSGVGQMLRFPRLKGDKHWTAYAFHMRLLAAGPSRAVHQVLYRRWQRKSSLTRSEDWQNRNLESLLSGQSESMRCCLDVINRHIEDEESRKVARYCLKLFQFNFIRSRQAVLHDKTDVRPRLHKMIEIGNGPIRFDLLTPSNLNNLIEGENRLRQIEYSLGLLP